MALSLWRRLTGWTSLASAESRRFDRYQITKLIHDGEKAFVYQVRLPEGEENFVIKAYKPLYDRTARRMRKRYNLRTEGEIGFRLNPPDGAPAEDHPIVRTIAHGREFDRPSGSYYIVQEYVDGFNLKRLIGCEHDLVRARRLDIARRVARALGMMHERGMIHRDICTDNILITRDGRAKLIDLGFAVPIGMAFREKSGTPSYMSPEQFQARPLLATTDIYSLGVVLYELFTGKLPFASPFATDNPNVLMRRTSDPMKQHLHNNVPPMAGDVPEGIEEIILRCLEKAPERRYPTIQALTCDLARIHDPAASDTVGEGAAR